MSCTSTANQPVPPTEHSDASWCGQCTRRQVLYSQTGATLRRHFSRAVAAAGTFVCVVAATSAWCRGTSKRNIASQMLLQLPTLRRRVSHAEERLRHQRFLHAGERLRNQRLSRRGAAAKSTPLTRTSRRHLVMDRPRASRSSSHRDERWEGCRV